MKLCSSDNHYTTAPQYMVFTTEVFLEVAVEGWPEWDLKVRLK